MEETLISFETAVLAKKKGLDLITTFFYTKLNSKMLGIDEHGRSYPIKNTPKKAYKCGEEAVLHVKNVYSAPTQGLLQKWLREVHNIHVLPIFNWYPDRYNYEILRENKAPLRSRSIESNYEQALDIGLQEALKLIE